MTSFRSRLNHATTTHLFGAPLNGSAKPSNSRRISQLMGATVTVAVSLGKQTHMINFP